MHSSRMRTVRSSSRLLGGGVPGPRGYTWSGQGVYLVRGVYLVGGGGVPGLGGAPGPEGYLGGVPGPRGYLARYSPLWTDRHV